VQRQPIAQHSGPCELAVEELQHAPATRPQQDFRVEELAAVSQAAEFRSLDGRFSLVQKKRISPLEQRQARCGIPLQAVSGTNARIRSCLRKLIARCRYKVRRKTKSTFKYVRSKKSFEKPIRFLPLPHSYRCEGAIGRIVVYALGVEQYPLLSRISKRR
jgi:hypothetical protein